MRARVALAFLAIALVQPDSGLAQPAPDTSLRHLYVAPTGNDGSSGGRSSPLRTITAAATRATPATVVHVAPGVYAETLYTRVDGAANKPILFVSDAPSKAVIQPSGATGSIWRSDGDYVTIKDFDLDGTASPSVRSGIYLTGAHSSVIGCEVHHIYQAGTSDSQGASGIILGGGYYGNGDQHAISNHVHDIGGGGLFQGIYHQSTGSVVNNVVHDVAGMGISLWHDPREIDILHNTVFKTGYGIGFGAGDWYGPQNPADHIRIINNIVYRNGYGIGDMGSVGKNIVVSHNMSVENRTNYNLQSGTPHTNDNTGTPSFVNYEAGDVRLAAGSAAINAGTLVGVVFDKSGVPRERPDLGAYEWRE